MFKAFFTHGLSMNIYIVVFLFFILLCVISLFFKGEKKNINRVNFSYKKKKVMSKTEREIFNHLKNKFEPMGYLVLSQVRLADFISVDGVKYKTGEWYSLFNRIAKKHCDIVIIDNENNVIHAIEINDFTHREDSRINRDIEVKNIFLSAGLNFSIVDKSNYKQFDIKGY